MTIFLMKHCQRSVLKFLESVNRAQKSVFWENNFTVVDWQFKKFKQKRETRKEKEPMNNMQPVDSFMIVWVSFN